MIPAEHIGEISRWGRVALAARAAMRLAPWFIPSPKRPPAAARGDLQAVDICSTLAVLAAVNGRQLAASVTAAAAQAAIGALATPNRMPPSPGDHAAMLAGLALEWSSSPSLALALDAGSLEAVRAAFDDMRVLLAAGLQERGAEAPVPKEFFSRPLWPGRSEQWDRDLARWQIVLAPHNLSDFVDRYRRLTDGRGMDLVEAQQRAEAWVREYVASTATSPATGPATSPAKSPADAAAEAAHGPAGAPSRPEALAPTPTLHVATPPGGSSANYADLQPYANAMAGMIDFLDSQSTFTVAIQGAQGSGRSVLAGMLERRLMEKPSVRGDQPHLTVRLSYNQARSALSVSAALVRILATALDRERAVIPRHLRRMVWSLQPRISRYFHLAMGLVFTVLLAGMGACAILFSPGIPPDWVPFRHDLLDLFASVGLEGSLNKVGIVAAVIALPMIAELFGYAVRTGHILGSYVRDPQGAAARGEVPKVRTRLGSLIHSALPKGSRIVIFVEDLERCGPERSMEFLNSIDEIFQFPELVFVLLTEAGTLARHAADYYHAKAGSAQVNRFIDLQVDLPTRSAVPGDSISRKSGEGSSSRSRSRAAKRKQDGLPAMLLGPLQRDWRGDSRFSDVVMRTMYVNPPYLVPVMVLFWSIFAVPVWEFATVQRWFCPPRCKRVFSPPGKQLWLYLTLAALLGHGVLVFQTINGLLSDLDFVILYPDTRALSTWVFVPIELVNLLIVAVLAAWSARLARERERGALARARAQLRTRIDQARKGGANDPVQVARLLVGVTHVAGGEEVLIREAVEESFLVSSVHRPLERLKLFLDLDRGMSAGTTAA